MTAGTEVRGVGALRSSLDLAAHELADLDLSGVGQLLTTDAEDRAPRRTGHLAASHHAVVTAGAVSVVNTAAYAAIVHTRDPWLAQTIAADQDRVVATISDDVAAIVARIGGK